eukprot:10765332-Lingulodinium_polyedra.AAC.1
MGSAAAFSTGPKAAAAPVGGSEGAAQVAADAGWRALQQGGHHPVAGGPSHVDGTAGSPAGGEPQQHDGPPAGGAIQPARDAYAYVAADPGGEAARVGRD